MLRPGGVLQTCHRKMLELVKLSEIMIVSARLAFRWCFSFAYGVGGVAMAAVAVLLFAAS